MQGCTWHTKGAETNSRTQCCIQNTVSGKKVPELFKRLSCLFVG